MTASRRLIRWPRCIGASFGSGTPDSRARQFLGQLEPVLPGITSKYIPGKATVRFLDRLPLDERLLLVLEGRPMHGQFSGVDKLRSGKIHFCGEHTSQDFQGYLNGGVETGERAAGEILRDYKAGILP